ncbi:unnamed protein product [Phytophthora lilii]|uniref:Unnamed protein product n=1 Tax=Phytophthora lilii TaxID=2077276 RepID=A0A9W6TBK8_9STRA|nr:unnamed protein product [Phytophthora lilii]
METWGVELALGFSMNVAVVAFCWISGWRPVNTSSSFQWHDTQRGDEETNDADDHAHESAALWSGGAETTVGLVIAVAVMVAVATEIASETGGRAIGYSRF